MLGARKIFRSEIRWEGNTCPWRRISRLNFVTVSRLSCDTVPVIGRVRTRAARVRAWGEGARDVIAHGRRTASWRKFLSVWKKLVMALRHFLSVLLLLLIFAPADHGKKEIIIFLHSVFVTSAMVRNMKRRVLSFTLSYWHASNNNSSTTATIIIIIIYDTRIALDLVAVCNIEYGLQFIWRVICALCKKKKKNPNKSKTMNRSPLHVFSSL